MSEHSELDERRLRKALHLIGDEAGREASAQSAARRKRWLTGSTVAAALLTTAVLVVGVFALQQRDLGDEPEPDAGRHGLSRAESIACSDFYGVVEVHDVRDADVEGRIILDLFVLDSFGVAVESSLTIQFDVVDPAVAYGTAPIEPGERLLILIYERQDVAPQIYRGDEIATESALLVSAQAQAADTSCPAVWEE